ncbi:diguanylate cyclase domain-containing protein, partial [Rhizobium ruizarguesonis]
VREHVTCSIGIALAPDHAGDADLLMRHADLALYAAKDSWRSTYRFYETEMRLAADAVIVELHDRLVMQIELALLQRFPQFGGHHVPPLGG